MPNPLLSALETKGDPTKASIPIPRFIEFAMHEIPDGNMLKPGQTFVVPIGLVVKAINDDGKILANVTSVNGNNPLVDTTPEPTISVQTQQSTTP